MKNQNAWSQEVVVRRVHCLLTISTFNHVMFIYNMSFFSIYLLVELSINLIIFYLNLFTSILFFFSLYVYFIIAFFSL